MDIDLDCGLTDLFCQLTEVQTNAIAKLVSMAADSALGGGMLENQAMMDAVGGQASLWLGLSVVAMGITGVAALAFGSFTGQPHRMKRALLGTLGAFPATMFAFFFVGVALNLADEIVTGLLTKLSGGHGFASVIKTLLSAQSPVDALTPGMGLLTPLFVLIVMLVGVAFMGFAMAFRDFVIVMLIAFAPLAFVMLPAEGGTEWVKRWASAMAAAVLAKPLMIGALLLVTSGFSGVTTIWSWETISLGFGFVMVSFLPLAAFALFNAIGGLGSTAGDQLGSRLASGASRGAQQGWGSVRNFGRSFGGGSGGGFGGGSGGGSARRPSTSSSSSGGAPSPPRSDAAAPSSAARPSVPLPPPSTGRPGAGPGADRTPPAAPAPRPAPPSPVPPAHHREPPPPSPVPPNRPTRTAPPVPSVRSS